MPTVICPRCENETLVLNCSVAVKHCATCGGALPDVARSDDERRRDQQELTPAALDQHRVAQQRVTAQRG